MNIDRLKRKRSAKIGVSNALKVSLILAFMYLLFALIRNLRDLEIMDFLVLLAFSVFLFLVVSLIAVPIGHLVGMSMFDSIANESNNENLEVNAVEKMGRTWGGVLGLMLSAFLSLVVFRRGDMIALIFYIVSIVFLASLFGGITARQILKLIFMD